MSVQPEVTSHNHNPTSPSEGPETVSSGDTRLRASRTRGASLLQLARARRKVLPPTEETRPRQGLQGRRSPWSEDLPSPRCVLADYREGADHFAGEAAGARWLYWLLASPVLAVNMAAAKIHVLTQRPARGWGVFLIASAIIASWLVLG